MKFSFNIFLAVASMLGMHHACIAGEDSNTLARNRLAETAELFFEADEKYRPGDLIVRSQVADFQDFLLKTQGRSFATSGKLLRRTEPDSSRLARAFFSPGGRQTLRLVAKKLGGYEPIVRNCKTNQGLQSLKRAVKFRGASEFAEQVSSKEALESLQKKGAKRLANSPPSRIYTVEQLVEAMLAPFPAAGPRSTAADTLPRS